MCLCRSRRNHPILPCLSRALLECCLSENTVYHNMIVYYCIIAWPRSLCRFSLGSSFSPASQFRFHFLCTRSTRLIKKIFRFPSVMRSQRGQTRRNAAGPWHQIDIPYIFLSFYPSPLLLFSYLLSQGHKMTFPPPAWSQAWRRRKRKGQGEAGWGQPQIPIVLYMHSIGQNCVTWPALAAREAGKFPPQIQSGC